MSSSRSPEIERGVSVIALPELQEIGDVPCDTGTDIPVLKEEMEGKPIDLSRLMDGWNTKSGKWSPTDDAVAERARVARRWLKARPEKHIIVVTHGGFLHFLTEEWTGYKAALGLSLQTRFDEGGANEFSRDRLGQRRTSYIPFRGRRRAECLDDRDSPIQGGAARNREAIDAGGANGIGGNCKGEWESGRNASIARKDMKGKSRSPKQGTRNMARSAGGSASGLNSSQRSSTADFVNRIIRMILRRLVRKEWDERRSITLIDVGTVLASFVDPRQAFGPDKIIPPQILANAKGLAIITVFKAGFLGSARFGSGVVVARLSDGTWSAPSALMTGGGGFGGQIGFELTDFVFILNDTAAVRAFSQKGSLTLGGNVSIAAGPVGRNAEAAGAASMKGVAGVFSYSKTKGLFAGVSLEGSVLIERREANEKLYNSRITARQLLEGGVRPPPAAEPLMRVLNSRVFAGAGPNQDAMYNDIPIYDDSHDNVTWEGRTGTRTANDYEYHDAPRRANTWADDVYDRSPNFNSGRSRTSTINSFGDSPKPERPTAPKPKFTPKPTASTIGKDQAIALFTFDADQPGDLAFKKGEVITITKRTENASDWWTGRIGNRTGTFPR
ncbi:MAG: hypothetical protein Q9163_000794 [Psora crenata]